MTVRRLSATFLDYLQGIQTIKALGATAWARRAIAEASQELGKRSMAVQSVAFLSSAVMEFFSTFAVAIVATYIGLSLLKYINIGGDPTGMSLQTGLFLLLLAPAYFQPLRAFAAAYHDRADALAASEHLSRLLSAPAQPPRRQELENVQRIELRNVTVHYPGAHTSSPLRYLPAHRRGAKGGHYRALGCGQILLAEGDRRVHCSHPGRSALRSMCGQRSIRGARELAGTASLSLSWHTG